MGCQLLTFALIGDDSSSGRPIDWPCLLERGVAVMDACAMGDGHVEFV